jgi:hypothetical protein
MIKVIVLTEKEKQEKAEKLFKFIDAFTESPGFKALCEEFNIHEEDIPKESTPEEQKEGWLAALEVYHAFCGRL